MNAITAETVFSKDCMRLCPGGDHLDQSSSISLTSARMEIIVEMPRQYALVVDELSFLHFDVVILNSIKGARTGDAPGLVFPRKLYPEVL